MSFMERAYVNTEAVMFTWSIAGVCVYADVGLNDSAKLLPFKTQVSSDCSLNPAVMNCHCTVLNQY
jgi:hypothetical protein